MGMDMLVSAALEEVCARGSLGLPVADIWTALSGAFEAAGLPLDLVVKRVLLARLIALPVISLVEGEREREALVHPAEMDVEEAERRGARLLANPALRDNFLGIYDHRCSVSELSADQMQTLECLGTSRGCSVLGLALPRLTGAGNEELARLGKPIRLSYFSKATSV
uniref:General transcription factor 3C polypeptide 1 winged-helix domain-containing protein n=1 Tax=Setaria italica TaxID=4555 RepID=K3XMM5_SETIT